VKGMNSPFGRFGLPTAPRTVDLRTRTCLDAWTKTFDIFSLDRSEMTPRLHLLMTTMTTNTFGPRKPKLGVRAVGGSGMGRAGSARHSPTRHN